MMETTRSIETDAGWMTEVCAVSQEKYDSGPFCFGATYEDGTLDKVIDSLRAIRDAIPEAYRCAARCNITSVSSYEDSHYATISVSYVRPETEEEAVRRADRAATLKRRELDAARRTFSVLKARLEREGFQ